MLLQQVQSHLQSLFQHLSSSQTLSFLKFILSVALSSLCLAQRLTYTVLYQFSEAPFFFFYFLIFLKSGCNFQSLVCRKLNGSIFLSQCKWNNCVSYNQHYLAFEEIWWLPRECIPIIKSLQLLLFFCLNTEILLLMNGWVLKDYL